MESINDIPREKIIEYIKQLHHPEISEYGLDLDYSLYSAFNKEFLLRSLVNGNRLEMGINISLEEIEVQDIERSYAEKQIECYKQHGFIDPITYIIKK